MNNWQLAKLFFQSPNRAFAELKQAPRFALPFLLMMFGVTIEVFWYYSIVDIDWVKEQMIAAVPGGGGAQQQAATPNLTRGVLKWSSTIFVAIFTFLTMVISALYLWLVGRLFKIRYSFRHWFAFSWWTNSPQIFAMIPIFAVLLFGNATQQDMSALQPLSLNELIFHRTMQEPGYALLATLTLFTVAVVWLSIIGMRVWSGRSMLFSVIYTLVPFALIFGTWAISAFK